MTLSKLETIEEIIGNAAVLDIAQQEFERRALAAVRDGDSGKADEWWKAASSALSGYVRLQLEATDRMLLEDRPFVETAKVTARLVFNGPLKGRQCAVIERKLA